MLEPRKGVSILIQVVNARKETQMARKALKVTLDSGDFYLKVVSPGNWGAFSSPDNEVPEFEFEAPEDATTGELEAEIDYFLMNNAPETDDAFEDEEEDNYAYNDRW